MFFLLSMFLLSMLLPPMLLLSILLLPMLFCCDQAKGFRAVLEGSVVCIHIGGHYSRRPGLGVILSVDDLVSARLTVCSLASILAWFALSFQRLLSRGLQCQEAECDECGADESVHPGHDAGQSLADGSAIQ